MNQLLRLAAIFAVAAVSSAFGQQTPQPKPPLGVPADARQFNGKWYRVYLEKGGWRQARDRCRVLGGQLVVVHDEPTHVFINELAQGIPLWLGATDGKIEGVWEWVDGTRMSFKAWGDRQPGGGRKEDFMSIWNGRWHDAYESDDKVVGFICEWLHK